MKGSLFMMLLGFVAFAPCKVQAQGLPHKIQKYYQSKNLLTINSSTEERQAINALYMIGGSFASIQNPKLKNVAVMLFSNWKEYYIPAHSIKGEVTLIPDELISPSVYKVVKWKRNDNRILVWVHTYFLDDNIKPGDTDQYRARKVSYGTEQIHNPTGNHYYAEIHEWFKVNGAWYKANRRY